MIYIATALYCEAHPLIEKFQLKREPDAGHFPVFSNEKEGIRLFLTGVGMIPAATAVGSIGTASLMEQERANRAVVDGVLPASLGKRQRTYWAVPERASEQDFLLNIGTCAALTSLAGTRETKPVVASVDEVKTIPAPASTSKMQLQKTFEIFLCHKIIDSTTGRTYYPDILYRHGCREAELVTGAVPLDGASPVSPAASREPVSSEETARAASREPGSSEETARATSPSLYDMEAAAIYQAGACFFSPHQMSFLKIVTDNGEAGLVTPELAERAVAANLDKICDYVATLQSAGYAGEATACPNAPGQEEAISAPSAPGQRNAAASPNAQEPLAERLSKDLHCSAVMRASLLQHLRYCELVGIDVSSIAETMYAEGKLPCKDKREGKKCFEELKSRLL